MKLWENIQKNLEIKTQIKTEIEAELVRPVDMECTGVGFGETGWFL